VLEFDAHPMDVLELHYRLAGAEQTVQGSTSDPQDTVTGKFSIFEVKENSSYLPMGLAEGRYMIPRAPSQILSNTAVVAKEFCLSTSAKKPWKPRQVGKPFAAAKLPPMDKACVDRSTLWGAISHVQ